MKRPLQILTIVLLSMTALAWGGAARTDLDQDRDGHRKNSTMLPNIVELSDARIKFEINATDGDGGIQVFLDADPWKSMSIYDTHGKRVFRTTTSGSVGSQGVTELFLESGEPEFSELTLEELLERFPEGDYEFKGKGLEGEKFVGTATLTHDIPDGPVLVYPLEEDALVNPSNTVVMWDPVEAPNGSPIVGYQVLVEQPDSGIAAIPKIVLDVMMPATATSMLVPPGFLLPNTEYEWEVLAIEAGGNQTLSSSLFTTAP